MENEANLEDMDGVVSVGGDGLVNEVVTGLLLVACRRTGVNPHDPEVQLPTTPLRLGVIPGKATVTRALLGFVRNSISDSTGQYTGPERRESTVCSCIPASSCRRGQHGRPVPLHPRHQRRGHCRAAHHHG